METEKKKYLNIGSLIEGFEDKETGERKNTIQLDNLQLKALVQLLTDHGNQYLKGLSDEDIKAGQNLKAKDPNRIPRITIGLYEPHENAPAFILKNLSIKLT